MISPIKIWILFTTVELPSVYQQSENNIALGSTGIEITSNVPNNFHQDDVTFEIPIFRDADSNGTCDIRYYYGGVVCTIFLYGDNHQGYIGFRDSDNRFMNNGAIDKVVNTWDFS